MAKAKKLPSGAWRCLVFSHWEEATDKDGKVKKKRVYKSFVSNTPGPKGKREAEQMAAEYAAEKNELQEQPPEVIRTVGETVGNYIKSKEKVLSQTTLRGYKSIEKNQIKKISQYNIRELTAEIIQAWVGDISVDASPKTVKNAYGLLNASLEMYLPDVRFKVKLPQKVKPDLYVPTDDDVKKVIDYFSKNDKDMLIAVYLASFGTMRRSEICALTSDDVKGRFITVNKAMVKTTDCNWIIKTTKNFSSNRTIEMPQFVIDILPKSGPLVSINPNTLSHRFESQLKMLDVPKFRFHDLRHYSASVMHAIGVPDVYIMERGGWSSDATLKQIYRGAMSDFGKQFTEKTLNHFDEMNIKNNP